MKQIPLVVLDAVAYFDTRALIDALKQARLARRRPLKLRMAKAALRSESR